MRWKAGLKVVLKIGRLTRYYETCWWFIILGFCYSFQENGKECKMKEGNPFGPFWDHFGIDFDSYVEHTGLLYETDFEPMKNDWNTRWRRIHIFYGLFDYNYMHADSFALGQAISPQNYSLSCLK